MRWAWWDWPLTSLTSRRPLVLWHCWLGHLTRKIISEMTYNVLSGMLNSTMPYHDVASRWVNNRHSIDVDVSALLTPRHYKCRRLVELPSATAPFRWLQRLNGTNNLPLETRACSSLLTFRRETKSHLFRQSYGWRGAVYSNGQQTSALSCATV